jgi:hypothetical protein
LWDEALNEVYPRKFVGGNGLAARYPYTEYGWDSQNGLPLDDLLY